MKHHAHFFSAILSIAFLATLLIPQISPETTRAASIIADECEGDACSQISVTWDETKERYKVQNNSTDQWVRVEAANLAATATTCVEPSKEAYLSLKSIVGAYKAKFDATCAPSE